jgi:ceramide glucosyltransferase
VTICPNQVCEVLLTLLAVAGTVQSLLGLGALQHFLARPARPAGPLPAVTILKPLHGREPMLEDALASCCVQDYPSYQIVFGLQSASDPALDILKQLRRRFPDVDMEVVIDATPHGLNRKIGNLINMLPFARHEVLVIADSDMHVAPDYLRALVATLQQPGTGVATTLYSGLPATETMTSRMGASNINHSFLPGALLARRLGRQDCLGATMALTRDTLEKAGGLLALSNHLADDAVLGRLVLAQGLKVALAATVPATTVPETDMPALFQHELRWARTVKSLAPMGFVLSTIQFPMFWAAIAVGISEGAAWAWTLFMTAWFVRAIVALAIDRKLKVASTFTIWWLPLRDLLSMTVILASYRTRRVAWRGQTMLATRPGLAPGKG